MRKKVVSLVLVILVMSLVLPGCAKGRLNELEAQITILSGNVTQLKGQNNAQEAQIAILSENVTQLKGQNNAQGVRIEELEGELSEKDAQITKLEETLSRAIGLRDPTYLEVIDFLKEDKTNFHHYSVPDYQIFHFAADLNNNAEKLGIRAGEVRVWLKPHHEWFLVVFQTTDRGLMFVDPRTDEIVPEIVVGQDLKSRKWTESHEITKFMIVW